MAIGRNPRPSRLRVKEEEEKTLADMVTEELYSGSIMVRIPSLKDLEQWGGKEPLAGVYSSDSIFKVPELTDFARLTAGGDNQKRPKYYTTNRSSSLYNSKKDDLVYINEFGFPKLAPSEKRFSREFIIQPVFEFKSCPKLFNLLTNNGEDEYIYFGEAPKYAADSLTQTELNLAYDLKRMNKTKDPYACDGTIIEDKNSDKKGFHKVNYPVYEYGGNKYMRFKVTQLGKDMKLNTGGKIIMTMKLSNGETYKNGDYVWIEVKPIKCKVNKKELTLVSQEGIIGGIQYNKPKDLSNSFTTEFLDLHFNLLQHPENYVKSIIPKVKEEEKVETKEEPDEVTGIINEIKKYRKNYFGKEDIDERVKKLLNDYNNQIDELSKNINSSKPMLVVGEFSPSLLHKRLILDLNDVLDILKKYHEDNRPYFEMIDILEMCKSDDIDPTRDPLCRQIYDTKYSFIASINSIDIKNKLNEGLESIIDSYLDEVTVYLAKGYKPTGIIDGLKGRIAIDIERWKQDSLIRALFLEAEEESIKNILNDIKSAHDAILANGNEEDKEIAEENVSLLKYINVNGPLPMVLRQVEKVLISLHKINYAINERKTRQEELDKYRLKVDTNTIFEDEQEHYASMR